MAKNYYYFVAGLPGLSLEDSKLAFTPASFLATAKLYLTPQDYTDLKLLAFPNDLTNLVALLHARDTWLEDCTLSADNWQLVINFCKQRSEDKVVVKAVQELHLPHYILDFLNKEFEQESLTPCHEMEYILFKHFWLDMEEHSNRFIRHWFAFDRDVRNSLIALNCKKHNLPAQPNLIGHDELTEKLSRVYPGDIVVGKEYPVFDELHRLNELTDIQEREKAIDQLRWKWIDQTNFFEYFTVNRVMGYYCKVTSLHRWLSLEQTKGEQALDHVLKQLEASFEFPEEFALNRR